MMFMKHHSLVHHLHPLCQLQKCSDHISLTLILIVLSNWAVCNLPDLIFSTLVHTRITGRLYSIEQGRPTLHSEARMLSGAVPD